VIYADANVIIRFVEGEPTSRQPIQQRLKGENPILTSRLSRLECRCAPPRDNNAELLGLYDTFFSAADLRMIEIDVRVIDEATAIRAAFGLTTPDAIHLAAAIIAHASVFLTGDKRLARFNRLPVEII
jgi:uncharacterized protein